MPTNTLPVRRYYAHMQYIGSESYQGYSEFVLFSDYETSEAERIRLKQLSDAQAERIAELEAELALVREYLKTICHHGHCGCSRCNARREATGTVKEPAKTSVTITGTAYTPAWEVK